MDVELFEKPFSDEFISEFVRISKAVFGGSAYPEGLAAYKWRLEHMPDVSVFVIKKNEKVIAFKAGYSTSINRYYSWLGGVDPEFRRQGLAQKLAENQLKWLSEGRFKLLQTHVEQDNSAMIQLNLKCGMKISGMYTKDNKTCYIMEKSLES